jgi:hypothetical protein
VSVVIVNSPSAVITAVTTWITPVRLRSKRILRSIAKGDGMAMGPRLGAGGEIGDEIANDNGK